MDLISIGVKDDIDEVYKRLWLELEVLSKQGIHVDIKQRDLGSLTFLDCSTSRSLIGKYSDDEMLYISKHYIANAISNIIIDFWEKKILKRIIDLNYCYFSPDERERIFYYSCKVLGMDDGEGSEGCVYRLSRKARVLQKILDYLDSNTKIIIEGFIRFRMKDYVTELEEAVDRAVEEYLMEREYNEFIKLLRYFVEIQEPKVDIVNVIRNDDGSYRMVDGQGKAISDELLDELAGEMVENNVNYDDLLISSLITIAPNRIVFHADTTLANSEILDTINKIFHHRVAVCRGCELCCIKKPIEKE